MDGVLYEIALDVARDSDAIGDPDQLGKVRRVSYRTLKSIFNQRDAAGADAEERARRGAPSAMTWDFRLGGHQMFCMTTPRMSVLTERALRFQLSSAGRALCGVAVTPSTG